MQKENYDVYLEGCLTEMPLMPKNKFVESEMTVVRESLFLEKSEHYNIILNWRDAMTVINHGQIGMQLGIYAVLRIGKHLEIVAEKVDFVRLSDASSYNEIVKNDAMHLFNALVYDPNIHTLH